MVKIAPSILSADFSDLASEIRKAEQGKADMLHLDIMDGHFVPNITFGPLVVKAIRKETKLPLDTHLMIENADKYVEAFARAGANIITIHVEACTHLHRTIQKIKEFGVKAGIALNPSTPLNAIEFVLDDADVVLVMSVNPGFSGQEFIPSIIPKIERLRKIFKKDIEVDGGINTKTAPLVVKAGANILVAGNSIYGNEDVVKAINELRETVK